MFRKRVAILVAFLAVFFLATLTPAEEEKPAETEKPPVISMPPTVGPPPVAKPPTVKPPVISRPPAAEKGATKIDLSSLLKEPLDRLSVALQHYLYFKPGVRFDYFGMSIVNGRPYEGHLFLTDGSQLGVSKSKHPRPTRPGEWVFETAIAEKVPEDAEKAAKKSPLSSLFKEPLDILSKALQELLAHKPSVELDWVGIFISNGRPSQGYASLSDGSQILVLKREGKWLPRIEEALSKVTTRDSLEIFRRMQLESEITDEGVFVTKKIQPQTQVFELKYARPEEMFMIAGHFLSKGGRIHVGPYSSLIVKGTKADIEAVENLIKRFDVPRPTLQFKFQLIKASKDEDKAEIPEELAPIAEELRSLFKYDRFDPVATGFLTTFADGQRKHLTLGTGRETPCYVIRFRPSFLSEGEGVIKVQEFRMDFRQISFETTLEIKPGETVIVGAAGYTEPPSRIVATRPLRAREEEKEEREKEEPPKPQALILIITAWVKEAEVEKKAEVPGKIKTYLVKGIRRTTGPSRRPLAEMQILTEGEEPIICKGAVFHDPEKVVIEAAIYPHEVGTKVKSVSITAGAYQIKVSIEEVTSNGRTLPHSLTPNEIIVETRIPPVVIGEIKAEEGE